MSFTDKKKQYFIGSDEACDIKASKGGVLGVIRYLDDIGWIIQAKDQVKDQSAFGIYIALKQTISQFKLYQGMSLQAGNYIINIKELS